MKIHLYKRHGYWVVDHQYEHGAVWRRLTYPTFELARHAVAVELTEWKAYANTQ